MNPRDEIALWLGATRYYLGRTSYAVSAWCDQLRLAWPTLTTETRDLIRRDVEEEFARDDRARADTSSGAEHTYLPLGHNCDRAAWETVRALWGTND